MKTLLMTHGIFLKFQLLFFFLFSAIFFNRSKAQMTKDFLDPFSTNSLFVIMKNGKDTIGNATAFTLQVKNSIYLITNNHVVGGEFYEKDFKKRKKRAPRASEFPDTLLVRFYSKDLWSYVYISLPINKSNYIKFYMDENQPSLHNILDIVAIKLPNISSNEIILRPYLISDFNESLNTPPGSELFVVGFPLNYGYNILYPIWKRGTVASETSFDTFLIDATTRFGMSGSPVVYRANSYTTNNNGYSAGSVYTFIEGIYFEQDTSTEIGVVAKINFVFNKLSGLSK